MTNEQMESSLERLARKLGLDNPEEDVALLLEDELLDAEGELLIYLGVSSLEEQFLYKAVELAALYYQRDRWELEGGGLRSSAYSEGQISQSEQYLSPAELRAGTAEILDSLARYRRVSC
ncbi:MAG: hypothetical protein LUG47_07505 [Clostridiales bacterium]|nr:hypothetical protein [Clostridiales bacterium]